ncbi:MAG: hypothetical protein JRN68_06280 [Nitrososphaerota archaeon]|nr:hypothetical protein [Nitrososphaerota archaeon]
MQKLSAIEGALTGLRVVLARNLTGMGWPRTVVAETLGISPSAVTLYTKGSRGKAFAETIRKAPGTSSIISELTNSISETLRKGGSIDVFPLILDAAYKVIRAINSGGKDVQGARNIPPRGKAGIPVTAPVGKGRWVKSLESRLEEEQRAARRSLVLAASAQDEVTRAVFRQIATDSIRHADLISMIIGKVTSVGQVAAGGHSAKPESSLDHDIQAMLAEEEKADEEMIKIPGISPDLKVLLESIELDERKHRILLRKLLAHHESVPRE